MTAMQPKTREEAKLLGLPDAQIDMMFPPESEGSLALGVPHEYDAPNPGGLLAPEKPASFWDGGKKFGGRDALAGLLAVIGDTAARQGGRDGVAIQGLLGSRTSALDEFKKKAEAQRKEQEIRARMTQANLTPAQQDAEIYGFNLPEQEKQHELQRLDALAKDPTQSPEVRAAAKRKMEDDPFLAGVQIPGVGMYVGRASGLPGVMGKIGGPNVVGDDEWNNAKPLGGGTGNGVGGFRSR